MAPIPVPATLMDFELRRNVFASVRATRVSTALGCLLKIPEPLLLLACPEVIKKPLPIGCRYEQRKAEDGCPTLAMVCTGEDIHLNFKLPSIFPASLQTSQAVVPFQQARVLKRSAIKNAIATPIAKTR